MSGISYSEFITLLKSGVRHTGYVEDLGDVVWMEEIVCFVKIYRSKIGLNGPFFPGEYSSVRTAAGVSGRRWYPVDHVWREVNDISIWQYRSRNFEIRSKRRYRIKVTPNPVRDRERYYAVRDNLRVENANMSLAYIEKELDLLGRRERELANALAIVNSSLGNSGIGSVLDVLGEFDITPKSVKRFTDILSCVSIIVDLDNEHYEDAAGKAFVFFGAKGLGRIGLGWVSTAFSVGSFMINTDYGKRMRLFAAYREYIDAENDLIKAYNNKDSNLYEPIEYKVNNIGKVFNELCDELNVPHLKVRLTHN